MADFALKLGMRIKELRRARGLRQEDMEQFGLNYRYFQKIEAGKANITLSTVERIAAALSVKVEEIFMLPLSISPEAEHLQALLADIISKNQTKKIKSITNFIEHVL